MTPALEHDGAECGCAPGGKVLLPFLRQPPIVTYNYSAFLLGALLGSDPAAVGFLHNNYIQLSSTALYNPTHLVSFVPAFGIDEMPALGMGTINILEPKNASDVESMVVEALNGGFYARVVLDEFYLPDKLAYQKRHFIHDNLITGYCRSCRTCFVAGYRGEKTGGPSPRMTERFGVVACPLASVGPAIFSRPDDLGARFLQEKIVLFQPRQGAVPTDIPFIKAQLAAYLSSAHDPKLYSERGYPGRSIDPWPVIKDKLSFGIGVYESLIRFTLEGPETGSMSHLRAYRLLWEHKACMTRRAAAVARIVSPDLARETSPGFAAIEQAANAIRLQSLFHRMTAGKQTGIEIAASLRKLMEEEQSLLARFIAEI
jgi:hypothetical protein